TDLEKTAQEAKDRVSKVTGEISTQIEGAIDKAKDLQAKCQAAADKAYAWAKDEAESLIKDAQGVLADCKKTSDDAVKQYEALKKDFAQRAEEVAKPLVDQAQGAYQQAQALFKKVTDATGELGK